jgi:mannose-6-phosphate isomerase-like protein (cupin superfamily)
MLMPGQPIIAPSKAERADQSQRMAADGVSFAIHEWKGSGPPQLHVHHEDDEAWHVLEGGLRFRFAGQTVDVNAGSTVFVPAGVAHTYVSLPDARYLVVLTPRLRELIAELSSAADRSGDAEIYRRHRSELLE